MFSIKGAPNIENYKILNNWLNENFVDGSVRAIFTEENHAKIIDQTGDVMPVEIQDGQVVDYKMSYSQKMQDQESKIAEAVDCQKREATDIVRTYKDNDFKALNSKLDSALQSGDTVIELKKEQTNLRLEYLRKTQWDVFLENDEWVPMEQPRQISSEYFDNPDIKHVVLQYQLSEEARQEIITEPSYMEKTAYGMPDRFYLGRVNGRIELIVGENFMDHELFHFSSTATRSYEISSSTLKEIAGKIYDYDDTAALTVDEQHINHEPGKVSEEPKSLYDAAIEEALEAAMIPEPEFEMEM